MYRKYVDLYLEKGKKEFSIEPIDREKLMDIYNRGGSHGGYYYTKNGRNMLSLHRPNHAGVPALKVTKAEGKKITAKTLVDMNKGDVIEMPDLSENYTFSNSVKTNQTITFVTHQKQKISNGHILNRTRNESLIHEIQDTILNKKVREKINGRLRLAIGEPANLSVVYGDICIETVGEIPETAMNQPMDKIRIEKQIRKTVYTPFEFQFFEIDLDGDIFMPMQSLNELRRNALESLEKAILETYRREIQEPFFAKMEQNNCETMKKFHVYVETIEQLDVACNESCVGRIYLDCNAIDKIWNHTFIWKII
jgi:putative protease